MLHVLGILEITSISAISSHQLRFLVYTPALLLFFPTCGQIVTDGENKCRINGRLETKCTNKTLESRQGNGRIKRDWKKELRAVSMYEVIPDAQRIVVIINRVKV